MSKQYWKKQGRGVLEGRVAHLKLSIMIQKRGHKFEVFVESTNDTVFKSAHNRLLDAVTDCASKFTLVRW